MAADPDQRPAAWAGISLMLLGVGMFSAGDVIGKLLVATLPVGQFLLLRAATSLTLLSPLVWRERTAFSAMPRRWLQLLRVALSASEVAAFFIAAIYLPLADIITFYLASPIFVTIAAALVLDEPVDIRRWLAVVVGFAGVVLALRPSSAVMEWQALVALAGGLAFAVLMVVTRLLRGTPDITLASTQLLGTLCLSAAMSLAGPSSWLPLTLREAVLIGVGGCITIAALFCVNRSLKLAPASVVVPYQYSMIIWAAAFGYLVFGDVPRWTTIAGAAAIVAAGLYIVLHERAADRAGVTMTPPPA